MTQKKSRVVIKNRTSIVRLKRLGLVSVGWLSIGCEIFEIEVVKNKNRRYSRMPKFYERIKSIGKYKEALGWDF